MSEKDVIPEGWARFKIQDAFDFIGGGTPSKNIPEYWNGDLNWASVKDIRGEYLYSTIDKITDLGAKNSSTNIAFPDDVILITRINPGRTITTKIKTAVNQDLKIIRPKFDTHSDFIKYLFASIERSCVKLSSGTTVLGISLNNLNEIEVLLPPIPEQYRIVAKIEELFSSLDKGIESLKTAQAQLKVYRQSVLKWAFEGKLTDEWRKQHSGTIAKNNILETIYTEKRTQVIEAGKKWKVPTKPTSLELEDIPQFSSDWDFDYLANITYSIGDVDHKMPKAMNTGTPYISTKDFDNTNGFSFDNAKRISEEDYNFLARKIFPTYGDILISRYGTVGEIREVKTYEKFQASYSVAIIKTLRIKTLTRYLIYCFQSEIIQKQIRKYTRATAQPDLGLEHMRQFIVPLPSLLEQEEIVQEIETRLSICDKLEETITTSLLQAESLRQSILKKAFEGKLVPQDPNDEPASVLLERIKAEKLLQASVVKKKATKTLRKLIQKKER